SFYLTCIVFFCVSFFFLFSSRRRHTRSKRDWSSDVCSSDLLVRLMLESGILPEGSLQLISGSARELLDHLDFRDHVAFTGSAQRSEERRVGKECCCWWGRGRIQKY